MRHQSPVGAGLGHIEDGVEYLPAGVLGWPSSVGRSTANRWHKVLYSSPLLVRQVS